MPLCPSIISLNCSLIVARALRAMRSSSSQHWPCSDSTCTCKDCDSSSARFEAIERCSALRLSTISPTVRPFRFTLTLTGKMMSSPFATSSTRGLPMTSRQLKGCIKNSSSPGYCDRNPRNPPMSILPAWISNSMARCFSSPLYCIAISLLVVVDMSPNSTPPRNPCPVSFQNCSGRRTPPRPLYSVRFAGISVVLDNFVMPLQMMEMVVSYIFPHKSATTYSGNLRRTAL
mmetsp:Transcript_28139/g.74280  ORF Transcript_28139/g.74280 Transcript_28139/m.74280 type:complete len:231 (+) Transcript_28139:835-1527(+)